MRILFDKDIDRAQWAVLVQKNKTGNWFQTPEAYDFFVSLPEAFISFVVAVRTGDALRGVCCGYIPKERGRVKQFMTRRAIIVGGPALADNATDEEVTALMTAVKEELKNDAIYVECRNFNSYENWKNAFAKAGFSYQPHLNIRMDTTDAEAAVSKIGKHKQHRIKTSLDAGARIITEPTMHQIEEYYDLLREFYSHHVRKPLPGWETWEALYHHDSFRYVLIEHQRHIIGGAVCVIWLGKAIYEWYACGRDDKERKISPASLVKYAEIQMAGEMHIPLLDLMGAGKPDAEYGVRDFKAEFGGETVEYGRFVCIAHPLLYRIGELGVKVLRHFKF